MTDADFRLLNFRKANDAFLFDISSPSGIGRNMAVLWVTCIECYLDRGEEFSETTMDVYSIMKNALSDKNNYQDFALMNDVPDQFPSIQ